MTARLNGELDVVSEKWIGWNSPVGVKPSRVSLLKTRFLMSLPVIDLNGILRASALVVDLAPSQLGRTG